MVGLVFGGIMCAPSRVAFAQDGPPFRVQSHQVVIFTWPFYKPSGDSISSLTVKDFRLYEDGKEQKIDTVTLEHFFRMKIRDNLGDHWEISLTPSSKWLWSYEGGRGSLTDEDVYLIGYTPPASPQGGCHRITISVDRRNSGVAIHPDEYCNTDHSPSDPLNGTEFSKQMEGDTVTAQSARVPLSVQANFFYKGPGEARVHVAAAFGSDALEMKEFNKGALKFTVGILGIVYKREGTVAERFSDQDECCANPPWPLLEDFNSSSWYEWARQLVPTGYETQFDLSPGEYDLRLVVSDAKKFGRAEVPLAINPYDGKQIGISSIALCKQFRELAQVPQTVPTMLLDYVPLVSKGVEYTPAGDTRFKKGEPLFAYFEVYEPLLAEPPSPTIQIQMKISNIKTGELKVDTGARSAAPWIESSNPVIPIAEQIAIEKLPKGSYRMEVQASDSAGKSTVWRVAIFSVE